MNVFLSDMTGKVVMKQVISVIAGNNPIDMNLTSLATGTYNIKVVNEENEIKSIRFGKF